MFLLSDALQVVKHIYQTNLVTSELARLNNHFAKGGLIIGDNAEPRLITELKHQGNNVVPCVKHKITEGIEMIRDYELIIDENSVDLIKELNNYCWLERKSETPIDKYNHALDALRYAVSYQLSNPNKGKYGIR
jgi:phage terminase large subunit